MKSKMSMIKPVFLAAQSPADPGSTEDDSKRNTDEGIDESSPEENEHNKCSEVFFALGRDDGVDRGN